MFCLPDMYEVQDRSLADIQYVLSPTFSGAWGARRRVGRALLLAGRGRLGTWPAGWLLGEGDLVHQQAAPSCCCPLHGLLTCKHLVATAPPAPAAEEVGKLDSAVTWARALDGGEYMPGLVGLNNMKQNDYANVVVQALLRVWPIR